MDLATTALRVAASLAAVLGLIWFVSRAARRRGVRAGLDTTRFTVVGRHSLSRSAGVTVLRVGDEALVLGVTDQSVQLLARAPLSSVTGPAADADADAAPAARRVVLPEQAPDQPRSSRSTGPAAAPAPALAGSALSRATWTQAVEALRERTTRR
jgi:flagellar protein FliO/FliZ